MEFSRNKKNVTSGFMLEWMLDNPCQFRAVLLNTPGVPVINLLKSFSNRTCNRAGIQLARSTKMVTIMIRGVKDLTNMTENLIVRISVHTPYL